MTARQVAASDNLQQLVDDINQASWDDANEMSEYDEASLAAYLARQDTAFMVCHDETTRPPTLAGMASARVEFKPYGNEQWLYVDEVDVCSDQRRKGVGKLLMQKLIELARERGCLEVWLGTETDNTAANALYRSLEPEEAASFVGYTYKP